MPPKTKAPAEVPAREPAPSLDPAPRPASAPDGIPGKIPLAQLRPSPTNPRKTFSAESLQGLADSIHLHGVLQPLVVRPVAKAGQQPELKDRQWVGVEYFEVVAGERRRRAAELAGLTAVPAAVRFLSDAQVLVLQLVENDQREDVLPSEQAAAYRRMAEAGATAERIAEAIGKPVKSVRQVLKLAKLPAWALSAVDTGTLPRATAELIGRVPGEESREKVAACVMTGTDLNDLDEGDITALRKGKEKAHWSPILTQRDTQELIRSDFVRELKGAPFDRKSLDLVPEAGACEPCLHRAGNDPDAKAEGVRADTCLDPDCFAKKAQAQRTADIAKAEASGMLDADLGVEGFAHAPRGWCDLAKTALESELSGEFPSMVKAEEKLTKLLDGDCPQRYYAFGQGGKLLTLVKTAEVRKALVARGHLKKPEKRKQEKPGKPATQAKPTNSAKPPAPGKPVRLKPAHYQIEDRAAVLAAKKCRDMLLANAEGLAEMGRQGDSTTDAAFQALHFVARLLIRDWIDVGSDREEILASYVKLPEGVRFTGKGRELAEAAVADMTPAQLVGFLLAVTSFVAFIDARDGALKKELLDYADADWKSCQRDAEKELDLELNPEPEQVDESPQPDKVKDNITLAIEHVCLRQVHGNDLTWHALQVNGATGEQIVAAIRQTWGDYGGFGGPSGPSAEFKGGAKPAIWVEPDTRGKGKPTLAGKALVDKVREVLNIPQPNETKQSTKNGQPKPKKVKAKS